MRRSKKKSKDLIGLVIIGFVLLTFLAGAITYFKLSTESAEINKKTNCRIDGVYDVNVIILDISDSLNTIQVIQVEKIFKKIMSNLTIGEQVQIYLINDEVQTKLKPILKLCNPGDGKNKNIYINNPTLLKKKWEKSFKQPLLKALENIKEGTTSNTSPIIESIQVVNNIAFPFDKKDTLNYKITIISDMIQNSKNISFYKDTKAYINKFSKTSNYYKVQTDLSNTELNIYIIRREKSEHLQSRFYINFYINIFEKMNAKINKIKMIDG